MNRIGYSPRCTLLQKLPGWHVEKGMTFCQGRTLKLCFSVQIHSASIHLKKTLGGTVTFSLRFLSNI